MPDSRYLLSLRRDLRTAQTRVANNRCPVCNRSLGCPVHEADVQQCHLDCLVEAIQEEEYEAFLAAHPRLADRRDAPDEEAAHWYYRGEGL
jgi:hypothetical protein